MTWINVKDRLPEDNQSVIACNGPTNVFIAQHSMAGIFLNKHGGWEVLVKYWQPLPPPFAEKEMG